jgi:hypothetical protein
MTTFQSEDLKERKDLKLLIIDGRTILGSIFESIRQGISIALTQI